jgi:Ca-activated chloride channel family protein
MDPRGEYLNVSADDLEVYENGVRQRVESFHEQTQPVSIVLALDASGSMRRKEADVIASASAFTAALRPQDQLALLLFSDGVTHVHEFSTDRIRTTESIARYLTAGGTALYDGLAESLALLQGSTARRVVVVMTDGRDENNPGTAPGSVRTLADVQMAVKATGATVFPIGLGTKVDSKVLQQLADVSGGRALMPQDVSQLGAEFQRVLEDLRRRYVVGYTSTNGEHDGKWRTVRIVVKAAPKVDVRSVGGYQAPSR